jgi:acyl-CoA reductase-like NAD-dependent aldehyde dehydrogenase
MKTSTLFHYPMLIDGTKVDATGGHAFSSIDPATEEPFAAIPAASEEDIDRAVQAARKALNGWCAAPSAERAAVLLAIASEIRRCQQELALVETTDAGKPIHDTTQFDVPDAANAFEFFARTVSGIHGETIPLGDGLLDYTTHTPIGVVAQIAPWNFPLVNAAWKIAPAIALGNTVVFKPSELASVTSLMLGEIFIRSGLPAGVVNIITGLGKTTGAALAAHAGVDKVSFTGSTATGKSVLAASGRNLIPATLELGGKSPNIVFEDAHIDEAVAGALFGIFFNAGQVCTAGSRLLVHESIHDKFLNAFADATARICVGRPGEPQTRMGPLISRQQQEKVLEYIASGVREGARLVYRGQVTEQKGWYVAPAIFTDVHREMRIAREEIFGPVVCVFSFKTDEEAVALANDTDYGLAAGIWTRDVARAHRVASRLDAGTVWVNTYNLVTPQMPAPTRKHSGIGVELGRQGLLEYTKLKNVVVNLDSAPISYF